jgi:hypothetical protein
MSRPANRAAILIALTLSLVPPAPSQTTDDSIVSQHVRVRIPRERAWLGRDSASDLERCWRFMNAATGGDLPNRILVVIDWNARATAANYEYDSITIAMGQAGREADTRTFLLHSAAREMARLGLYGLSRGASGREGNRFLTEGMAEILVHEYERTSRNLGAAWVICRLLDKMKLLRLSVQSAWTEFSGGRRDLRAASPGITFLMTCRELHGREKVLKLFESLRKANLRESLTATFKTDPVLLEESWLKKVREYQDSGEVTATTDEDAPHLLKAVPAPESGRAGLPLRLDLFVNDATNNLSPWGIFLQDEASGKVLQAQPAAEPGARHCSVSIPVESGRPPGQYNYRITAVDEAGNVRTWTGTYTIVSQ